ncbi:SRPBCC family protein [Chryseobacterium polytrichastri]|uniref:Polyketide cyclase / dehydrase and lipid transport n=1 Tax=Chryseobacterium polytrichastri TaxID=1302687 RepID=A0A1M7A096_9FLAO|nr:SRPBCC family protein [Chryseobacterium polytrichastri]SHL36137.1 Polyketide cyclase / dehydrase and lipid transport [Chryseobacterium polytrichastri]
MKILKGIAIVMASILIFWLIIAAFISGDCNYEKSISINAPVEKVWQNTNTLRGMDEWSPWNDLDPGMKKDWIGITGQAGEKVCWESKEAGSGCQEVIKIDAAKKRIDTDIKFLTPYESEAHAYVTVVPEGNGSKATWGFTSKIPYPFTVMKMFMKMEDAIGKDYQKGLLKLKEISEKP